MLSQVYLMEHSCTPTLSTLTSRHSTDLFVACVWLHIAAYDNKIKHNRHCETEKAVETIYLDRGQAMRQSYSISHCLCAHTADHHAVCDLTPQRSHHDCNSKTKSNPTTKTRFECCCSQRYILLMQSATSLLDLQAAMGVNRRSPRGSSSNICTAWFLSLSLAAATVVYCCCYAAA
eukprot:14822-Heterococcus_DN1.PRE.1